MGLLDEIHDAKGVVCQFRVDVILAELSKEDAADLRTALADRDVSARQIARALSKRGTPLSDDAVRTWRTRSGVS